MQKFISSLFCLLFCLATSSFIAAQTGNKKLEETIGIADKYFELTYYRDAIEAYQQVVKMDSKNAHANYQLAECYRLLFNYQQAETYYKKAAEIAPDNFPLALFYLATMQKMNKKYYKAIKAFEHFINNTKHLHPERFTNKERFFKRAIVEIEGCYWALDELTDYECTNLDTPINTALNNFGASIVSGDTAIIITSEEIQKIRNKNIKAVETNNFYYHFTENKWNRSTYQNLLQVVNTRFNDGQGCFNKNRTKYYYTSCGQDDPYCKIYVTTLQDSEWQLPVALNQNVNTPECDNKQPFLSDSGDTLFFVSNRNGGYGMNDIWMSVKQDSTGDGDLWGEVTNLGRKVNTAFNEISPFYSAKLNLFFFASDGHRGMGGFDVFMATIEQPFRVDEISNLSIPVNSNLDDCYFVLGDKKGFLSSNRRRGVGKFDIYSFCNMFKKKELENYQDKLATLRNEVENMNYTVGNKEALAPDEILSPLEREIYERILSVKFASYLYGLYMPYMQYDYQLYQKLNKAERNIIDHIYAYSVYDLDSATREALTGNDQINYRRLTAEEKKYIDNIYQACLNKHTDQFFVELDQKTDSFYTNLKIERKKMVDRLVAFLLSGQDMDVVSELHQDEMILPDNVISDFEQDVYERIISVMMAAYIYNIPVQFTETDYIYYQDASIEDRSIIDMLFALNARKTGLDSIAKLQTQDKQRYQQLKQREKEYVTAIAKAMSNTPADSIFVRLQPNEKKFYSRLTINDKKKIDRLIASRIQVPVSLIIDTLPAIEILTSDDLNIKELTNHGDGIITREINTAYERIITHQLADFIYGVDLPLLEADYQLFDTLSIDDKSIMDMMLRARILELNGAIIDSIRNADKKLYRKLSEEQLQHINNIAETMELDVDAEYISVNEKTTLFYNNLIIDEKRTVDRLIAYSYTSVDDELLDEQPEKMEMEIPEEVVAETDDMLWDQILSVRKAGFVYGFDNFLLKKPDFDVFENLSIDDKSLIDMLYEIETGSLSKQQIDSMQQLDEQLFGALSDKQKENINKIVEAYNQTSPDAPFVNISDALSQEYSSLDLEKKKTMNRLIAARYRKLLQKRERIAVEYNDIKQDELSIEEISNESDVITTIEKIAYDRLVSLRVAAYIHELDVPYTETDFVMQKNMDIEDKSIVDMMYRVKIMDLEEPTILQVIRQADKQNYAKYPPEEKQFIDRIVQQYLRYAGKAPEYITLQPQDSARYANLDIQMKYKTDRIFVWKLRQELTGKKEVTQPIVSEKVLVSDKLNIKELRDSAGIVSKIDYEAYERILAAKLARYIYGLQLPLIETDSRILDTLSIDDKSIIDMIYRSRIIDLTTEIIDSLYFYDKKMYQLLSDSTKNRLDRIVHAFRSTPDYAVWVRLESGDKIFYQNLSIQEKRKIDRVICYKLSNRYVEETKVEKITIEVPEDVVPEVELNTFDEFVSVRTAGYIYHLNFVMTEPDFHRFDSLSIDDKSLIEMFYLAEIESLTPYDIDSLQRADQICYDTLPLNVKDTLDAIANAYAQASPTDRYVQLPDEYTNFVNNLSTLRKKQYNRLIAMRFRSILNSREKTIANYEDIVEDELNMEELSEDGALISEQENFVYERILSFRLATYIHELDIPYIEQDYRQYNALTIEDLSILDMMYELKTDIFKDPSVRTAIQNSDEIAYQELNMTEKGFIDRVVNAYLAVSNTPAPYIALLRSDSLTYAQLNVKEKYRTDRILVARLRSLLKSNKVVAIEEKIIENELNIRELSEPDGIITPGDLNVYERVLSLKLAAYIHSMDARFIEYDYFINQNLNLDDKSILDMMYTLKVLGLQDTTILRAMQHSDEVQYRSLPADEKQYIDRLVNAYIHTPDTSNFITVNHQDSQKYAAMQIDEKFSVDRLIMCRLRQAEKGLTIEEYTLMENDLNVEDLTGEVLSIDDYNTYERILSLKIANHIYNDTVSFVENDFRMYNRLSIDDLSLIDMMYEIRLMKLDENRLQKLKQEDELLYKSLKPDDAKMINRLASAFQLYRDSDYTVLSAKDAEFYANLNLIEKNRIDRIAISRLHKKQKKRTGKIQTKPLNAVAQTLRFKLEAKGCSKAKVKARLNHQVNNKPASNMNITLQNSDGEILHTTISNQYGYFGFPFVPANVNYTISVGSRNTGNFYINELTIQCREKAIKTIDTTTVVSALSPKTWNIENIYFTFDGYDLTRDAKKTLNYIVLKYKKNTSAKITLNAFTDDKGTNAYNLQLSKQRGQAALQYLIAQGVSPKAITMKAYGETSPVVANTNAAYRSLNRRVEVILSQNGK